MVPFVPFRIKVCGVTRAGDALAAAELGADAIGLNFYPRSLRSVLPNQAEQIVAAMPTKCTVVGVFVNPKPGDVEQLLKRVRLDFVQLHGDETPDAYRPLLKQGLVIKAIRVPVVASDSLRENESAENSADSTGRITALRESIQPEIDAWQQAGAAAVLLDAAKGHQFGGTGHSFPWRLVPQLSSDLPLLLAGGLKPQNVAQAIREARPDGVDVASGVEGFPGCKQQDAMRSFIETALKTANWPEIA